MIKFALICLALSKHCRIDLLTTFSSTTKRSLQPHNDKLLIGSQQFLISVQYLPRLFYSLILINWTSRTAVFMFYIFLLMLLCYGRTTLSAVALLMMTTTCFIALWQTSSQGCLRWLCVSYSSLVFYAMTLALLSDHKRIWLNDTFTWLKFTAYKIRTSFFHIQW